VVDEDIYQRINTLVDEEKCCANTRRPRRHSPRAHRRNARPVLDLLRQRRALREFGRDPEKRRSATSTPWSDTSSSAFVVNHLPTSK